MAAFRKRGAVVGTYHRRDRPGLVRFDLTTPGAAAALARTPLLDPEEGLLTMREARGRLSVPAAVLAVASWVARAALSWR